MIESMFTTTCKILRRDDNSRNRDNIYTYIPSDDIKCLFSNVVSFQIKEIFADIKSVTGMFVMTEEIKEVDKIQFEGYNYEILPSGVLMRKDLFDGNVKYYTVLVGRRRVSNETKITINQ